MSRAKIKFFYFLSMIFFLLTFPRLSFSELPYTIDFETGDSSITIGNPDCKVTYVGGHNACADYNATSYYCTRTQSNIDINATAAHSGSYGLEIEFLNEIPGSSNGVKWTGNTVVGTSYFPDPIYFRMYIKFEDGFYWKAGSGNIWKLFYLETGLGDIMPALYCWELHSCSSNYSAEFLAKEQGSPGPWDGDHVHGNTNGGNIRLESDRWYCFEWAYSHSSGKYFKVWIDGVLRLNYDESTSSHGTTPSWNGLPLNMIHLGGLMNYGSYQTQSMYVDDIIISNSYIGPIGGQPPTTTTSILSITTTTIDTTSPAPPTGLRIVE